MNNFIFLIVALITFASSAEAGLDSFSRLDEIEDWSIERRVDSKTKNVRCRASIPNDYAWFGGRIRLDQNDELVVPHELSRVPPPGFDSLKKVKLALRACRSSLIYIFE